MKSPSNCQTNAVGAAALCGPWVRGRANHISAAPPTALLLRAKSRRKRRLRYAWRCGADLLYRQRHVFFSAGRKENVGLELWVLEVATLWLTEYNVPGTRNGYLLYARIFSIGACGAVLSTGGKYPKTAGAFRCAPDPWRLLKRRRARYSMHFGKQSVKQFVLS